MQLAARHLTSAVNMHNNEATIDQDLDLIDEAPRASLIRRILYRIAPFAFIAVLWQIEAIAGDLKLATGYCGKAGQRVPAGVGQPHVLLRELTLGGTAT